MNISPQSHRNSNFDFLRLFFASLVIVSHSFPLTGKEEILDLITNKQESFGSLAVSCFFILSGYFIFISLKNSKTIENYLWKRFLRLFPALIVLVVFTLLVIPLVYHGSNIFTESSYYSYGPNVLSLYKVQYYINGVFEHNPYPRAINGSLWSLSYEFTLYLVLAFLFFLRQRKLLFYLILAVFVISYFFFQFHPGFLSAYTSKIFLDSGQLYKLTMYFFAGSLLSFINFGKINTLFIRILLVITLVLSFYFPVYKFVAPIISPLLVMMIGSLYTPWISKISQKLGDISYGVYIYGFLLQQLLMEYFDLNAFLLTSISLPLTYIFAYLSWHLVEKKMQKYKNLI